MKYIKKYEERIIHKYEVDDYIFLNYNKIKEYDEREFSSKYTNEPYGKIIYIRNHSFPYNVEFFTGNIDSFRESEIIRKLTSKEIEVYEENKATLSDIKKYNL